MVIRLFIRGNSCISERSELIYMKPKRVGVLMGGPSCEREISIKSGKAVCQALANKNIECIPIELEDVSDTNGYKDIVKERLSSLNIDVAFIALHGEFGEDGTAQKILEDIDIPYTGSKVLASQLGMDKIASKDIFRLKNIPVARHEVLEKVSLNGCNAKIYFEKLGPKIVIKPFDKGSSMGLSIIESEKDFYRAAINGFRYSQKIIIEEYIPGREITVGIVEDKTLPIVEILPKRDFFDWTAKYEKSGTEYIVPARINQREYRLCQDVAFNAHKALGVRSFSRVDMILNNNKPIVLEVNTIPGLTHASLLPKAALAAGIDFEGLCLKILESASW